MTHQKAPYCWRNALYIKRAIQGLALGSCLSLVLGCSALGKPESFTFIPDFPPDFKYELKAIYLPAKGQTCSLPGGRNFQVSFNKPDMEYEGTSEIELYRTVSECPMALNLVEIKVIGVFGSERSNRSSGYAAFAVRTELLDRYKGTFNAAGEGKFSGECQWFFRTVGPKRYLIKILYCKNTDAQGNTSKSRPFTAYTLDQLPGKTVKLEITLTHEEEPYMGDTWVKVPDGWKRCMGKGFEDQHAFCYGNHKDFSTFRMVDERVCTIYPGCTENKEETP
jgi:hypothetical protein